MKQLLKKSQTILNPELNEKSQKIQKIEKIAGRDNGYVYNENDKDHQIDNSYFKFPPINEEELKMMFTDELQEIQVYITFQFL